MEGGRPHLAWSGPIEQAVFPFSKTLLDEHSAGLYVHENTLIHWKSIRLRALDGRIAPAPN